jgi:D-alanyl-D-alanine carboxypeptidase/D-alanyl-D-alanine-endopeptidase (penicillin-binding protein 4)
MIGRISRRSFLSFLAASAAIPGCAAAPDTSTRPTVRPADHFKRGVPGPEQIIAEAKLGGKVCFAVADARTGKLLEGGRASEALPPASVAKALTALYAMETLGTDFQFTTRVVAQGTVENGVLRGDLFLVGGGDPTLDTDGLAALAASLKQAGLREVRGDFKVASGLFPEVATIDPSQPDHVGYSPGISGIALNFNRVHFEWKRSNSGYGVTMQARTDRYRPGVAMARMKIQDRQTPVYTYRSAKRVDEWTVARGALGRGGSRWLPVRKPALYAADVFQTLARSQGIVLKNPKVVDKAPADAKDLARLESVPLRTILRDMLKFSTNVTAEMVGLMATVKRKGRPASLAASAREMNAWAETRFAQKGMRLKDHSGLNGGSRMTPAAMVATLSAAYGSQMLRPILKKIPMRDARGRPEKGHPIEVQAKTGTLNFVSGLAGYMSQGNGRDLVFAIFAADETTRNKIAKQNREAPQGARSWNRRAKAMHQKLIERWGLLYSRI